MVSVTTEPSPRYFAGGRGEAGGWYRENNSCMHGLISYTGVWCRTRVKRTRGYEKMYGEMRSTESMKGFKGRGELKDEESGKVRR